MKKIITFILTIAMLVTSLQLNNVYADNINDTGNNTGNNTGDGNHNVNKKPTWAEEQQGYRIYIVDNNFSLQSSILDITYGDPLSTNSSTGVTMSGYGEYMYNSIATEGLTTGHSTDVGHKVTTWEEVCEMVASLKDASGNKIAPLSALYTEQTTKEIKSGGDSFKTWVVTGMGGEKLTSIIANLQSGSVNGNKGTSSIGGSSGSGNSGTSGAYDVTLPKRSDYNKGKDYVQALISSKGVHTILADTSLSRLVSAEKSELGIYTEDRNKAQSFRNQFMQNNMCPFGTQPCREFIYDSLVRSGVEAKKALALAIEYGTYSDYTGVSNYSGGLQSTVNNTDNILNANIGDLSQIIPTAESKGYFVDLLNYMSYDASGNAVSLISIRQPDGTWVNSSENTRTISKYDYKIIVEPVFWLKFAYTQHEDNHPIYGSLRDIEKYIASQGQGTLKATRDRKVTNSKGPNSLLTASDVTFGGTTIQAGTVGIKNYTKYDCMGDNIFENIMVQDLVNTASTVGYAMHIYGSDGKGGGIITKTRNDDPTPNPNPSIPHPAPVPKDETKDETCTNYIVKCYEVSYDNGATYKKEAIHYSSGEPQTVYLQKEKGWTLEEWYVSKESSDVKKSKTSATWKSLKNVKDGAKTIFQNKTQGQSGSSVDVTDDDWMNNEEFTNCGGKEVLLTGKDHSTTLYILFRKIKTDSTTTRGNVDLTESQISAVKSKKVTNKIGKVTVGDESRNVVLPIDTKSSGVCKVKSGTATNYKGYYTIYRGDDPLTLFKNSLLDSTKEEVVSKYTNGVDGISDTFSLGGTPGLSRLSDDYESTYGLEFFKNDKTTSLKKYEDQKAKVAVYSGLESGSVNTTVKDLTDTATKTQVMASSGVEMSFYPFIWMTTQSIKSINNSTMKVETEKQTLNVLSTHLRKIQPNDYACVSIKKNGTINIDSSMWAVDKSISDLKNKQGTKIGKNVALKGGATYSLKTNQDAIVNVTTYQTVSNDNKNFAYEPLEEDSVGVSVKASEKEHEELVNKVGTAIAGTYELKQYVNKNANNTVSGSGTVEVCSGASISGLSNGSSTASTKDKYYLRPDGDLTNSSLLETKGDSVKTEYYRFFSVPNGDIYMVGGGNLNTYNKCQDKALEIIEYIKGKNGVDDKYTSYVVLKKGSTTSAITNSKAKDINTKTLIISKLLKALELNTGSDKKAPWATTDGTWYNEGIVGITVMIQSTDIRIGIGVNDDSAKRVTVLDPKLIPKVNGKSDQNTKIFSSNYKANYSGGDLSVKFRKKTLKLKKAEMKKLFGASNTFYIPNSTVTDNK